MYSPHMRLVLPCPFFDFESSQCGGVHEFVRSGLEETALYYVSLNFTILKRRQNWPRMSHQVE